MKEQLQKLRVANESLVPELTDHSREIRREEQSDAKDADATPGGEEDAEFKDAVAAAETASEGEPPEDSVISITKGWRFRRLHYTFAPRCNLIPGIDYKDFKASGETMPTAANIDALCKNCFPEAAGRPVEPPEEIPSVSSDEDSAASSASQAEAAAVGE